MSEIVQDERSADPAAGRVSQKPRLRLRRQSRIPSHAFNTFNGHNHGGSRLRTFGSGPEWSAWQPPTQQHQYGQHGGVRGGQQDMAGAGKGDGLAEVEGKQQRHGRSQQVAAPLLALPHGGRCDQLGQPQQDQPDRDRAAVMQQRRQVATDQATKRSPGSFRSSSADSRAKVACGSKPGTISSAPTTISLSPRTAL
jgi:hypothetical protein